MHAQKGISREFKSPHRHFNFKMVKSLRFLDLAGLIEIGLLGRARSREELMERTEGPVIVKGLTFDAGPWFNRLYRRTGIQYSALAKPCEKSLFRRNLTYKETMHGFWDMLLASHSEPILPVLNEAVLKEAIILERYNRETIAIKY